jgi:hypothetical protein
VGTRPRPVAKLRSEIYHPQQAENRLEWPNPGDVAEGWSYDCGMATLEVERKPEPSRPRFPATSTPTSPSTTPRAPRPASRWPDGTAAVVYAGTPNDPTPHRIGLLHEVDVDRPFERGLIFGITVKRVCVEAS